MPAPIAFDVTRMFTGSLARTPRGIDRVESMVARLFFDDPGKACVGVLPTPWGVRTFARDRVLRALDRLERLWSEDAAPDADPAWRALSDRIRGAVTPDEAATRKPMRPLSLAAKLARMSALARAAGLSGGAPVRKALPEGAVYLNIGHFGIAVPWFVRWLDDRPDVAAVFMLHDVIPLVASEYCAPRAAGFHMRMVRTTARYASGLIVSTEHARATVTDALRGAGRDDMVTFTRGLPLAAAFDKRPDPPAELASVCYFVACGAIEPRKNHALLLETWKRLVEILGDRTPNLVIVGSLAWRGYEILDSIVRCPSTAGRIHVVSGLSSPALKRLIAGATASLMPSFSEGFGLPLIEARDLGTPVIASDIPAHREVVGEGDVLVDPMDCPSWVRAVLAATAAHREANGEVRRIPPERRQGGPTCRHAYADALYVFLQGVAEAKRLRQFHNEDERSVANEYTTAMCSVGPRTADPSRGAQV